MEFTIALFVTENQQFSYRAIISAKIVASLQTAALQKSGIKSSALSSQQFTGDAQPRSFGRPKSEKAEVFIDSWPWDFREATYV